MTGPKVQEFLLRKHGIRVCASMAEYVVRQLASDGSISLSLIGREARTGAPMRASIALDEVRSAASESPGESPLNFPKASFPEPEMIITAHAYARAGLVGNPSDGYFGKTISFIIRNFAATVQLWESPHFEIVPAHGDFARFDSVADFLKDQKLHGYYGGLRLIKAAVKKFHEYCRTEGRELSNRSFTISYHTDIPRLVGMAGSSALIVATLRTLMKFYDVEIDKNHLPTLTLSVERDELGISAGLQDRVIQVFEGIAYMDFDKKLMETRGYGNYEPLRLSQLPPLYVAFDPARAEVSDVPHRNLRELYNRGDKTVVETMQQFRTLTDRGKSALMTGDWDELGKVVDENFAMRQRIMSIAPENLRMVEVARSTGASGHFCGSGGAICGLYKDGRHYQTLVDALAAIRCSVLRPLMFEA